MSQFSELEEVLDFLKRKNEVLKKDINECLIKIKESEYYMNSFLEKEEKEYKFFSPRDVESTHKEEFDKIQNERKICEEQYASLLKEEDELKKQIENINTVLNAHQGTHVNIQAKDMNLSIIKVQEEDRQRIARDLHDTSLQNLAHLIHKLELASLFIEQDSTRAKLELGVVRKNLKDVIDEIRSTIYDLRPMTFDDFGVKTAIERLLSNINERKKYVIDMELDEISCENNLVLVTIYRVVQECISNICKHSNAKKIIIRCQQVEDVAIIDIKDDGKGFILEAQDNKHFGLSIMKERVELLGGHTSVSSEVDKGTSIHICVPLLGKD